MKRVGLMILSLILLSTGLPMSAQATSETAIESDFGGFIAPQISEIFLGSNPYIELYFGASITPEQLARYYIATSTKAAPTQTNDFNTNIDLSLATSLEADSYKAFAISNGSLSNPNAQRYVWLCDKTAVTNRTLCVGKYVDFVAYGHITDTNYSVSRREWIGDGVLELSRPTPDAANDFDLYEPGGDGDDADANPESNSDPAPQYCRYLRLSEISANEKWVEVYNASSTVVRTENLDGCTLEIQAGETYHSKASEKENVLELKNLLGEDRIEPYGYTLFFVNDKMAKTAKDRVIELYDNDETYSETLYSTQKVGTSAAYFADGWKVTYHPTPGEENIYQQWQNCDAGKHINEATGNCVKDAEPPAECADGQFRNPATGRCKKIASDTALAECAEGQFRNPATNRCKKIASDDDLKPCVEGYERNPETNRCRKIPVGEDARFGIGPTDGSGSDGGFWLMAGGLGAAVIGGLIAWQFAPEISRFARRVAGFVKHPRGGV